MIAKNLRFLPRNTSDFSPASVAQRTYKRMRGKSLKHILLDRFINHYGYDKGEVTASAIIDDLLSLVEQYYRYTDNSFLKQGQMVWPAVPVDEYPAKGKSMAQTKLKPIILDIISESDIEDMQTPINHRVLCIKKIERWTHQAYDQGGLLSQLDLAALLTTSIFSAGNYVREYQDLYQRSLPTRGNIQLIGGGQTHKKEIITLHIKGYLVPVICTKTNHSKEAVERYIHDYESVKMLATKFDDVDLISRIIRLTPRVVKQYLDLIPLDS
ncbi:MAG: DUF1670 domain-containing protein [Acidobacteriota bacterium]